MYPIKTPKKLIEVALPLDLINTASAKEKTVRHGHPSSLHLWWARRPLAVARAVLFAQMVNDPGGDRGYHAGMTKVQAAIKREELFRVIEELVLWENTNNEALLERAREFIWESWRETCRLNRAHPDAAILFDPLKLPAFHDPFSGGGALPLEAQRLGLESFASDLNPVAVMLNKANIEIPSKFTNIQPVGPLVDADKRSNKKSTKDAFEDWSGVQGLGEDIRRYGAWMGAEAEKRIGNLYPMIEITEEMGINRPDLKLLVGRKFKVIAWLWSRTVKSPSPLFSHAFTPLATSFILSSKVGKQVYVEPIVEKDSFRFEVRVGIPTESAKEGTKVGRGGHFKCLFSDAPIPVTYIREQGKAGQIGQRLMGIVAEGVGGRIYLSPTLEHEQIALQAFPEWEPKTDINHNPRDIRTQLYGLMTYADLFTKRQLVALVSFSDLIAEVAIKIRNDAIAAGMVDDGLDLESGGRGATAYAQAVCVYLAFAIDKMADLGNSLVRWEPVAQCPRQLFGRQAIPMIWDFAEANCLGDSSGSWSTFVSGIYKAFVKSFENVQPWFVGYAQQADAQTQCISENKVISTDPPYYDNIGYADLSDFFYVWLRRSLKPFFPLLFATLTVPKAEELVATSYRHGGKDKAETFFLDGMTLAMHNLAEKSHPAFPVTIYYAFKQTETAGDTGTSSTGWETFLDAVLKAGFSILGTWPMRTENASRMVSQGTNALASSIVLVCRKREVDAVVISRRDFIRELNATLPEALVDMTRGGVNSPVAPVDLSQAIIGPGMAIFSKYGAVLEADGKPMNVRAALQLINRFFAEDDFDHDTQFCLHWFDNFGWATGGFGDANTLAQAKGTSVGGLQEAGVVESGGGTLRLLRWAELTTDWSPETDSRTPIWEALHQTIRALNQEGESAAGALLARMPSRAESMRSLAYRLYTLCERKGWAEEARAYNELVTAWASIEQASSEAGIVGSQAKLDI